MRILMAVLLGLFLGGCATTAATVTCPPLIKYSDRTNAKASEELQEMGDRFPTIRELHSDYGKTRNAIRDCRNKREF